MKIGNRITRALLILFIISPAFAQTKWTPIGPEGGWVDDIVFNPDNPDILYVGGDIYGCFYKSTDGAVTSFCPVWLHAGSWGVHKSSDAGELATSGMYFYKLKAGEFLVATRKMVLLK